VQQKQITANLIKALKGLLFSAIVVALLFVTDAVMRPEFRPFDSWPALNELPHDSVDVLMVGNSHAYTMFAPMQLWDEQGVTSWILGSGSITVEQRLTMLQAGLRTQSPELIIFELWMPGEEESQREAVQTALYTQVPLSSYKVQGLLRDVPPEAFWENAIPLIRNQSRWNELTRADFEIFNQQSPMTSGGAHPLVFEIDNRDEIEFPAFAEAEELDPFVIGQIKALPQVVEVAEEAGADLVFVFAPVASDEKLGQILGTRQMMAQMPELARTRVVDMNDFAESDMGLTHEDFYDPGHLFLWGMRETTSWLYQEVIRFHTADLPGPSEEVAQWWDTQAQHWNKMDIILAAQDDPFPLSPEFEWQID